MKHRDEQRCKIVWHDLFRSNLNDAWPNGTRGAQDRADAEIVRELDASIGEGPLEQVVIFGPRITNGGPMLCIEPRTSQRLGPCR